MVISREFFFSVPNYFKCLFSFLGLCSWGSHNSFYKPALSSHRTCHVTNFTKCLYSFLGLCSRGSHNSFYKPVLSPHRTCHVTNFTKCLYSFLGLCSWGSHNSFYKPVLFAHRLLVLLIKKQQPIKDRSDVIDRFINLLTRSHLTCWTFSKLNKSHKLKYGHEYQTSDRLGEAGVESRTLVL